MSYWLPVSSVCVADTSSSNESYEEIVQHINDNKAAPRAVQCDPSSSHVATLGARTRVLSSRGGKAAPTTTMAVLA